MFSKPFANLNHFTAATGPEIVHAHRMPEDLQADFLFTEPVGRLIRRSKIVKTDGLTQLRNAYPGAEFVLGPDPFFRPVNIKSGPGRHALHCWLICPGHHPGVAVDAAWQLPARED